MNSGDTVSIAIDWGDAQLPAQDAYGIAFTVSYDPEQVEANTITVSFDSCWLGTLGSNLLTFVKNRPSEGEVDIAITRTDHQAIIGQGEIARVDIIMVDDLNKKLLSTNLRTGLGFGLAQDAQGIDLPLDDILQPTLPQSPFPTLQIFPNPVGDKLCFLPGKVTIYRFSIYDLTGRKMLEVTEPLKGPLAIDVSQWAAGMYVVSYIEAGVRHAVKIVKE